MQIVFSNQAGVGRAVKFLKNGGVIIFPTDTAYGLGGIFNSKKVISRVLKIKNRRDRKFTLVCSGLKQAEKFFKLNKEQKKLAKKFWPGPLSLAISRNFSIRAPKNKLACELARRAGRPLIATSANLSGGPNIYDGKKAAAEFANRKNQPDLIIDGGKLPRVKPSTLIRVKAGRIEVLREGPIKINC